MTHSLYLDEPVRRTLQTEVVTSFVVDVIVPLPRWMQGIVFPATGAADAVPAKRVSPMMAMRLSV